MSLFHLTAQEVSSGSPSKAEYEAAVYCDACFDTLDALDRQQELLKVQIETRGIMINESNETIGTMRILLNRMREQYYISEKNAKKAKRKAWWRGLKTGAGVGVAVGAAIIVLSVK